MWKQAGVPAHLYKNVPCWVRNNDVNVYSDNQLKISPKERVQSLHTVQAQQITNKHDTRFECFDTVIIIAFDCDHSSVFSL